MMYRAIFTLMAIGLAAAQQDYHFNTTGSGGVKCGAHHRCLTGATCEKEAKTRLDKCVCPHVEIRDDQESIISIDRENSNAKIGCTHPLNKTVVIQSDPHLRTFYKDFANLPSPCLFRVTRLNFTDPEINLRGVVEVYGENILVSQGEYYLRRLIVKTDIRYVEDTMEQIMELKGDIIEKQDDIYKYEFIAKSIDGKVAEDVDISAMDSRLKAEPVQLMPYIMDVRVNETDNLLNVTIRGLGLTVLYRPPSVKLGLDNRRVPFVPGAMLIVDNEHFKMIKADESRRELSNSPQGPSLKDQAKQIFDVNEGIYVQYLMLNNSLTEPVFDEICHESSRIFREECLSDDERIRMIEDCSLLYKNQEFIECISEENSIEDAIILQKEFFQRCERSYCSKDKSLYEDMLKDISTKTSCPLPRRLENSDRVIPNV